MATLDQLVHRVQDASDRRIGADYSECVDLVNSAFFQIVREARTTATFATLDLVAGQGDYSLANLPILSVLYIAFTQNGMSRAATPVDLGQIINWRGLSGEGAWPFQYALTGFDLLSLYPTPGSSDSAVIYYLYRPDPLGSPGDSPPDNVLPREFHDLIALGALASSVRTLDKGRNNIGVSMATQYTNLYEAGLSKLRKWRNRTSGTINRVAQVGPARRPRFRNDYYASDCNY